MFSPRNPLLLISLLSSLSHAITYHTQRTHKHHKSPQEFEHGALDHEKEIIEGLQDIIDLIAHRPFHAPVYNSPQGEEHHHRASEYYGANLNLRKRGEHDHGKHPL